jgi:hypothetical protein
LFSIEPPRQVPFDFRQAQLLVVTVPAKQRGKRRN